MRKTVVIDDIVEQRSQRSSFRFELALGFINDDSKVTGDGRRRIKNTNMKSTIGQPTCKITQSCPFGVNNNNTNNNNTDIDKSPIFLANDTAYRLNDLNSAHKTAITKLWLPIGVRVLVM